MKSWIVSNETFWVIFNHCDSRCLVNDMLAVVLLWVSENCILQHLLIFLSLKSMSTFHSKCSKPWVFHNKENGNSKLHFFFWRVHISNTDFNLIHCRRSTDMKLLSCTYLDKTPFICWNWFSKQYKTNGGFKNGSHHKEM